MKLFYVVAFLLAQQLALPLSSAHPLLRNLAASEGGTYDFSGDATTYGDGHEWASGINKHLASLSQYCRLKM